MKPIVQASAWLVLTSGLGYAASAIFSGVLHWDRALFVLPYATVVTIFVWAYIKWGDNDLRGSFRRHRIRGLLAGIVVGLILIVGVMAQPASTRPDGSDLVLTLVWLGVVYGAMDALLLNVVPVLIVYQSAGANPQQSWYPRIRRASLALAASLLVTAAYHLGYAEFQGPALIQPLIGNIILTMGYLLTGSPMAAIVAHTIMHVAAVLHGAETTFQLPPHY